MLGADTQKRVQENLRRIDATLVADMERVEAIGKHVLTFRDAFFGAFQYIERECLQLKALLVQLRRLEANQLQIQSKGSPAFILMVDPEPAYDRKPAAAGEPAANESVELAARMFAVLAPPARGMFRHYSIFADGSWKRSLVVVGAGGVSLQQAMIARYNDEMLTMEAVDLLGQVVTAHASWANLAPEAEHMSFESLRDHSVTRSHPLGMSGSGGSGGGAGPRLRKLGSSTLREQS